MSTVTTDEDLDRVLDERAIGHLDFEPRCELKLAVMVDGSYVPAAGNDCDAAAVAYVECRRCRRVSVNTCGEHLRQVMAHSEVHCFGCETDAPPRVLLQVVPLGRVS